MALFSGLECGRAYFDAADAPPFASMFSRLAALIRKSWRRLIAQKASSRF